MHQPNAQMQAVLESYADFHLPPPNEVPAQVARHAPTLADAVGKLLTEQGKDPAMEAVGDVRELAIPGPAGDIKARAFLPTGHGPHPVIVYVHGGGWVIASIETYESSARALCNATGAIVVSTHYRQAPEHPYPAAHDDVYAATRWVMDHAQELGGDPSRLAIVGESAGGNMATATCLRLRDEGLPLPLHQGLVYPVVDADFERPSYVEYAEAKPLSKPMMQWFWDQYAPDLATRQDPYATPIHARLEGLPPATIIAAEIDPLQSEGAAYAERLKAAGVPVAYRLFPGVTHEFFGMGAVVDDAQDALNVMAAALRQALGSR